MSDEHMPHIDVYNFEDVEFVNSRYVLTSPRSLEASSRLAIKPIELLHKPLSEFQEDLLPKGISLQTVREVYDSSENERKNKLLVCREERARIIEQSGALMNREAQKKQAGGKSPQVSFLIPQRDTDTEDFGDVQEVELGDVAPSQPSKLVNDDGSLQRQRTAWTTMVGHDRISNEDLQKRVDEIHSEAMQLRDEMLNIGHPRKPRKGKAVYGLGNNAAVKVGNGIRSTGGSKTRAGKITVKTSGVGKKTLANRKKQLRLQAAASGAADDISDISTGSGSTSGCKRRGSEGPHCSDAKPITDPTLRNKLPSARVPGTKVTPRDQKILELMLAKREQEHQSHRVREEASLAWEQQRAHEQRARANSEARRRRTLSEQRTARDKLRQEKESQMKEEVDEQNHHNDKAATFCRKQWAKQSEKQALVKARKVQEKKSQSMERKRSVEEKLEIQRREMEQFQEQLREKQEQDMKRASSMRKSLEEQQIRERKIKNHFSTLRHKEKAAEVQRHKQKEQEMMGATLQAKLLNAENQLHGLQNQRDGKLRRSHQDLLTKQEQCQRKQQQAAEELEHWKGQLENYWAYADEQSGKIAKISLEEKRRKAKEDRILKEKLHKDNLKKLHQQEAEWKAEVKDTIASKEEKFKKIQEMKEQSINESRKVAQTSQLLREELRKAYTTDQIKRLAQQAEIENKIGLGNITQRMNGISMV